MAESRGQLKKYSMGIVAANKALNSDVIEVTPIEHFPMIDGELTSNAQQYSATGTDANGTTYQDTLATTLTVQATWAKFGSMNRTTAPDVRRGEKVQLWRYADADGFYWTTQDDSTEQRRLETVTHAYSGTTDESTTKLDGTNSYYHEVSTHNGYMHWHTSKANGEPFGYDVQINAKEGYVTIQDDVGHCMRMDSKNQLLTFQNAAGSILTLDKKNCNLIVPETFSINCKDYVLNASNSVSVNSKTGTMKYTNLSITANTTHNGNIGLNGNLITEPGNTGNGDITMSGNMKLQGNMDITGVVTAAQGANFGGTVKANVIISVGNIIAPNV